MAKACNIPAISRNGSPPALHQFLRLGNFRVFKFHEDKIYLFYEWHLDRRLLNRLLYGRICVLRGGTAPDPDDNRQEGACRPTGKVESVLKKSGNNFIMSGIGGFVPGTKYPTACCGGLVLITKSPTVH
jgi:hypothetical protein